MIVFGLARMSAFPEAADGGEVDVVEAQEEGSSPARDASMRGFDSSVNENSSNNNGANKPSAPPTATPQRGTSPAKKRQESTAESRREEREEQRFVDEFGFELADSDAVEREQVYIKNIDGKKVCRREIKWTQMTKDWEITNKKAYEKMKERCRKGIPSKFRGFAWQLLTGSRDEMIKAQNSGVYVALTTKKVDGDIEGLIERDLGRTFPNHMMFRDDDGIGQTHLRRILRACANIDPEVGYVQGMGFIVGTLLTQMGEEEAFWCTYQLLHSPKFQMREVFKNGFPKLKVQFYMLRQLMKQQVPKLAAHCDALNVDVSFYASRWFLTLLVYHFPFRAIVRVWDIFMCEGWKIIFRVIIAMMRWEEVELLQLPFDQLVPRLNELPGSDKDPDEIIVRALKVKFKTSELDRWEEEAMNGAS